MGNKNNKSSYNNNYNSIVSNISEDKRLEKEKNITSY